MCFQRTSIVRKSYFMFFTHLTRYQSGFDPAIDFHFCLIVQPKSGLNFGMNLYLSLLLSQLCPHSGTISGHCQSIFVIEILGTLATPLANTVCFSGNHCFGWVAMFPPFFSSFFVSSPLPVMASPSQPQPTNSPQNSTAASVFV